MGVDNFGLYTFVFAIIVFFLFFLNLVILQVIHDSFLRYQIYLQVVTY